ncbi:MAG TPA: ABC transporter ATP-binding protein [Thermodesulfobacteriota bacterium]|nr:ABC transporter ATP-binding protein [Thermodesulfobacteriota bacterium]
MLTLGQIDVYYGNIQALWKVSLGVEEGEIITIVGSNGAGKSTILRSITGLIKPRRGSITFDSRRIDALSPDEIVRRGVSMVPEGRELFPRMTVLENLELGAAYIDRAYGQTAGSRQWVLALFPVLQERSKQQAGTLSGGEQQMLAIGRALMSRPKLLMLDEPSLGLAPLLVAGVFRTVQQINQEGVTVLLVEQNVRQSLTLAHRAYVLENGRMVMEGEGKDLIADKHVKEAYLGL